jgi:hypothetical protein
MAVSPIKAGAAIGPAAVSPYDPTGKAGAAIGPAGVPGVEAGSSMDVGTSVPMDVCTVGAGSVPIDASGTIGAVFSMLGANDEAGTPSDAAIGLDYDVGFESDGEILAGFDTMHSAQPWSVTMHACGNAPTRPCRERCRIQTEFCTILCSISGYHGLHSCAMCRVVFEPVHYQSM